MIGQKKPQKELKKVEISNVPDKEFKVVSVKEAPQTWKTDEINNVRKY